jgi:hypothetical protein
MTFLLKNRRIRRLSGALFFAFIATVAGASAGTVTGTVRNGTTGKLAAGVEMILIQLQGGMQPIANTKTDAEGRYKFDNPNIGTAPMLLRAVYRGVLYHEPLTPGKTNVDVQVFEPTDKAGSFAVTAHAIILQPKGSDLVVGEEYNIENKTQPPVAYYRSDGSFLFSLPDGAKLSDVSAVTASGMPVIQNPIDKAKNQKAITYAFRPGDSGVRVAYQVPYPDNQTKLTFVSPYPAGRLAVFAPPTVQVSGDGLSSAGQEQGFNVYMREAVAANTPLQVSISGTAPPPPDDGGANGAGAVGDNSQNPSVNSRADSGAEAPSASVTALPARLDSLKWVLVSGFAAIFALGLVYLWRRPDVTASGVGTIEPAQSVRPQTFAPANSAVADVKREVRGSLDELKDTLFRLELRRQAGTISEEDYTREHARIETLLREMVRG